MPKDQNSPSSADQLPANPATLEAELRAKIEAEIRAEYEQKLRAAGVPVTVPVADGKPAIYYHQQGRDLVGVPVIAAGSNLHDPKTGALLVTGAQSSTEPANGRYILKS